MPDDARAVEEHRRRIAANTAELAFDVRANHGDGVRDVSFAKKIPHGFFPTAVDGQTDDDKPCVAMTFGHALEQRHLDAARETPRRPEVDQDYFATKRVRRNGGSVECRQCITRPPWLRLNADHCAEVRQQPRAGPYEQHQPHEIPRIDDSSPARQLLQALTSDDEIHMDLVVRQVFSKNRVVPHVWPGAASTPR